MFDQLPSLATPEGLHKICQEIQSETVPIEEVSEGLPQGPEYIQQNIQYGILLEFVTESDGQYQLTTRGINLSYVDGILEPARPIFYDGLSDAECYTVLLDSISENIAHTASTINQDEVARILRVEHGVEATEDELGSKIKTFFKTLDAAGIGEFILGRGNQDTRVELASGFSLSELLDYSDDSPPQSEFEREVNEGFDDFDDVLRAKCLPMFHRDLYQQAVINAFVVLEDRVRTKGSFDYDMLGENLMAAAFTENDGPLAVGNIENEQEGFRFLYQGVFKALRNPNHHHLEDMDRQQAHDILSFINFLLTLIENQS